MPHRRRGGIDGFHLALGTYVAGKNQHHHLPAAEFWLSVAKPCPSRCRHGAVAGAAVGFALDDIDRQARVDTEIHQRPLAGLTTTEVVAMSQAGLGDEIMKRQV